MLTSDEHARRRKAQERKVDLGSDERGGDKLPEDDDCDCSVTTDCLPRERGEDGSLPWWPGGGCGPNPVEDGSREIAGQPDRAIAVCEMSVQRPRRRLSASAAKQSADKPNPLQSPKTGRTARGWGRWWLAACLVVACVFGCRALFPPMTTLPANGKTVAATAVQPASWNIEDIRVGQRVIARDAGTADAYRTARTNVDPATWRFLRLRAEDRWSDGTLDTIEVETLQPPEWVDQFGARPGATVPLPLALVETGLPEGLKARVVANESCPAIPSGAGCVVLTTVNHLNPAVYELTLSDPQGRQERVRSTGFHKFYSDTRQEWVSAKGLRQDEQLRGLTRLVSVLQIESVPGVHRVYNFTVEDEHCYRVSTFGALVHNNGCGAGRPPLKPIHPDSSLRKSSLDYWGKKSNQEIIDSLKPGQREALRVYPDGRIANGNTRIKLLKDRGVDVDSLPREIYIPDQSAFPNL